MPPDGSAACRYWILAPKPGVGFVLLHTTDDEPDPSEWPEDYAIIDREGDDNEG